MTVEPDAGPSRAGEPPATPAGAAPPVVDDARALQLELAHRRFLLIEQGVGAAIFNLLLNGAIAYFVARSLDTVPLWGRDVSIAGDTIFTTFLLPFFTCLFVTRLARTQVEKGKLPPLSWRRTSHATLRRLPARTSSRAVVLGLAGLIGFAPVAVWTLVALEVDTLGFWSFVTFKALFAAVLAALFTPLIALIALGDASAPSSS